MGAKQEHTWFYAERRLCWCYKHNIVIYKTIYLAILSHPSIEWFYFTNSAAFSKGNIYNREGNFNLSERDAFMLFIKGAVDSGYQIAFRVQPNEDWTSLNEKLQDAKEKKLINVSLSHKVLIELKLTGGNQEKILKLCFSISPSAIGRGWARLNKCIGAFQELRQLPGKESSAALLKFFNGEIEALYPFNR